MHRFYRLYLIYILWHFRAIALSGNALCDQYIQTNPHEAAVELANRLECSSEKGEDIGMYICTVSVMYIRVTLKLKIKNSIKPHRHQYIQRHFYYTTRQKLCKFEALSKSENPCNCYKDS